MLHVAQTPQVAGRELSFRNPEGYIKQIFQFSSRRWSNIAKKLSKKLQEFSRIILLECLKKPQFGRKGKKAYGFNKNSFLSCKKISTEMFPVENVDFYLASLSLLFFFLFYFLTT